MTQKILLSVWAVAVAATAVWTAAYTATPGAPAAPPLRWPADSALAAPPGRPTLLLFAHPTCPCSRASLDELALILDEAGPNLTATVVLQKTSGPPTPLQAAAAELPGATVFLDDGAERRRFRARTSGETLLYGSDGRLLFRGGVTAGRGHRGENPGRLTILALLAGPPEPAATPVECPVYGCPLAAARFESDTRR